MFELTLPASAGVLPVENLHASTPLHDMPSLGQEPDFGAPPPPPRISAPCGDMPAVGQNPDNNTPPPPNKFQVDCGQSTEYDAPQPKNFNIWPNTVITPPDGMANIGNETGANAPPPQPKLANLGQSTEDNAPPPQPKLANLGQATEGDAPPPPPK